jgi:hypothetical protein
VPYLINANGGWRWIDPSEAHSLLPGDMISDVEPMVRPTPQHQWIDGAWVQGPPPIPQAVTPFQASRALLQFGMLDAVEIAVAAANRETQLAWSKATTIERNSPFVASMAAVLPLTDAQLDDLFILAASFV